MGGMKSGAGEDPFDDLSGADDPDGETETDTTAEHSDSDPDDEVDAGDPVPEHSKTESASSSSSGNDTIAVDDLPYIARRNVRGESVKSGRDKNILFELRPEIADREEQFIDELEAELGTDVSKTDAREAALAAIWARPELVAPVLEEWGLGYFEN